MLPSSVFVSSFFFRIDASAEEEPGADSMFFDSGVPDSDDKSIFSIGSIRRVNHLVVLLQLVEVGRGTVFVFASRGGGMGERESHS